MAYIRKFSSLPLHPLFQTALPGALSAAVDGAPGLIALDRRGLLALGRFRLRPAGDRILRVELADAARLGGVGALRLPDGGLAIPDLDGTLARALPADDRQAAARALALARATLLLKGGAAALARAETRRREGLTRRLKRTVLLAAPEAAGALRGLDCQLELACHLHELTPHAPTPLLDLLADRRGASELAGLSLDRHRMRRIARRDASSRAPGIDWAARDARLDAYLDGLEAPGARRRGA